MSKNILIDASYPDNVQVAVVDKNRLVDLESSTNSKKMIKGNIYLAKVTRVEPSLQAAFIDYGGEKNGFIPFAEIHADYYNVPSKFRQEDAELDEGQSEDIAASSDGEEMKNVPETDGEDIDAVIEEVVSESEDTAEAAVEEGGVDKLKKANVDRYKIQEVIKRNQIMLVQAVKEERGNKGAAFTSYVSLAGRCCVIMPNSGSKGGVSRKIEDTEERSRLKAIVDEISSTNPVGVIIRTVGQGRSKDKIENDYNYLVKLWNNIREKTLVSTAPAFVHSEDNIFKHVVRDMCDNSVDSIIVEGNSAYNSLSDIVKDMSCEEDVKLTQYKGRAPILNQYGVDEQILNLYNPVAYTESGAYIVINPTEALIAIDVNSGKSTSERNIEKMALRTNLEAAKEIVRQIRLRDLSGIIVIDFIDMMEAKNRRAVERTFKDLLYNDKAKVQIGSISSLGLLEVSRQRLKPNFLEANTVICTHCHGKGVVRSCDSNAITILKTVEGEVTDSVVQVNVFASPDTVLYMLNNKREAIKEVEEKHSIKLLFNQDYKMSSDGFAVEVVEGAKRKPAQSGKSQSSSKSRKSKKYQGNKDNFSKEMKFNKSTKSQVEAPSAEKESPVLEKEKKNTKPKKRTNRRKSTPKTQEEKSALNEAEG